MAVVHHSPESESKLRSVEEEEEDAKRDIHLAKEILLVAEEERGI